jgi:phage replication O-like protein O
MANPQAENGHIDIANEVMDALVKTRIPGEARQCLDFIIRKTWGWHKKEDFISLSQFAVATGMKKPHVSRAIKFLLIMKLIIKYDNGELSTYRFNKDFDLWIPLSKKITTFKKESSLKRFCYLCNFSDAVEEHHIKPILSGGSNRIENKIVLCPNCHTLVHKGKYSEKDLITKKDNVENITQNDNVTIEKSLSNMGTTKENTKDTTTKDIKTSSTPPEEFLKFWDLYPKKVGKQDALKSWNMAKKKGILPLIEKILEAIRLQKEDDQWCKEGGQYIPNPSTWLNQGRWDDQPIPWQEKVRMTK